MRDLARRRSGRRLRRGGQRGRRDLQPQVLVTDIRMPPVVPARGHRRGQGGAHGGTPAPAWWCCRSSTTRSTRSRCWPRAPRVTATCSRTGSRRAASWWTRSGPWPPAAPRWTRPSWPRWSSRSPRHGGLTRRGGGAALSLVAEGRPIKAIAAARQLPAEAVDAEVEAVFVKLAAGVSAGQQGALQRLAAAAPGDRGPRGAGRDAVPAAARRPGGEATALTAGRSARPSGSW